MYGRAKERFWAENALPTTNGRLSLLRACTRISGCSPERTFILLMRCTSAISETSRAFGSRVRVTSFFFIIPASHQALRRDSPSFPSEVVYLTAEKAWASTAQTRCLFLLHELWRKAPEALLTSTAQARSLLLSSGTRSSSTRTKKHQPLKYDPFLHHHIEDLLP